MIGILGEKLEITFELCVSSTDQSIFNNEWGSTSTVSISQNYLGVKNHNFIVW